MFKRMLKSYDYSLITVILILSLFGLVMVYSSSMINAVEQYEVTSDYFFQKQRNNLIVALLGFALMAFIPYRHFKSNKFLVPVVFGSVFGLGLLGVFGHIAGNANSWFKIGALGSIQPSEFAKLCVIIYLSAVYAKKQQYINTTFNKGVIPPLVYLVIICALVVLQPDIGTASIIFMISCSIILCSGMNLKNLLKLFLIAIAVMGLCSPVVLAKKDTILTEKRIDRIEGFLNPFEYEGKEGYHLVNSYIAIGSGGLKGQGLGESIQKYGYLPEPHTDFILAIIAEELGIMGVSLVLFCLAFIVLKGYRVAIKCKDPFGSMIAIGVSSMIGIQSFINIGGVTGLIPITGVPLPFVSYGGSSLLVLFISVGLLVNVSMRTRYDEVQKLTKKKIVSVDKFVGK